MDTNQSHSQLSGGDYGQAPRPVNRFMDDWKPHRQDFVDCLPVFEDSQTELAIVASFQSQLEMSDERTHRAYGALIARKIVTIENLLTLGFRGEGNCY